MRSWMMRVSTPFPQTSSGAKTQRTRFFRRRWVYALLAVLLIGGLGIWWFSSRRVATTTTSTATVSQGNLTIDVSGSGTVAAARTVELPFQQSGTVTSVDVKVGDQVTAGQTLATIDDTDLQLALQQAQA